MREDLSANDFADDVGAAKTAVDVHMESRRKVVKVPVENMDNVGQRHGFCVFKFSLNPLRFSLMRETDSKIIIDTS